MSHAHGWATGPAAALSERILGLRPLGAMDIEGAGAFSETLSSHSRGRKLIEHRRPIVQNEHRDFFSTTVSSNMLFGGCLGDTNKTIQNKNKR